MAEARSGLQRGVLASQPAAASVCLVTGGPGSGKTTLVGEALKAFPGRAGGFFTRELRVAGARQGFLIVALDGQEATLAHIGLPGPPRVGKYGVDLAALERVGVAALRRAAREAELVVVDEIGRMELASPAFRQAVEEAMASGKKVLATVMQSPHPFADDLKGRRGVRLLFLSRANYPQVLQEVLTWLRS